MKLKSLAEFLGIVVGFLKHEDMCVATVAAAVLWALAPFSQTRASIAELGGVAALHSLLVRTLKVRCILSFPLSCKQCAYRCVPLYGICCRPWVAY
jgi:hypothetical protein